MYSGQCPRCSRTRGFSERGLKRWTVMRTDGDGYSREVLVAIDYYWRCDACGGTFSEHIAEPKAIEREPVPRPREPSRE